MPHLGNREKWLAVQQVSKGVFPWAQVKGPGLRLVAIGSQILIFGTTSTIVSYYLKFEKTLTDYSWSSSKYHNLATGLKPGPMFTERRLSTVLHGPIFVCWQIKSSTSNSIYPKFSLLLHNAMERVTAAAAARTNILTVRRLKCDWTSRERAVASAVNNDQFLRLDAIAQRCMIVCVKVDGSCSVMNAILNFIG